MRIIISEPKIFPPLVQRFKLVVQWLKVHMLTSVEGVTIDGMREDVKKLLIRNRIKKREGRKYPRVVKSYRNWQKYKLKP